MRTSARPISVLKIHSNSPTPHAKSQRKRLPIGIQTFKEIREDNHYYVDKTPLALQLIQDGKHYFLSRPRRFGKSLFLDTLKELFEGNKPLFDGLAAYPQWDWSVSYPVIRFSFGRQTFTTEQSLANSLDEQLTYMERDAGLTPTFSHAGGRFSELIRHLREKHAKPVVILIDEYDKPILDALDYPEVAKANRDFLRGFYGTIKDYDAHIRFSFLTGVSKFSKGSLTSDFNDITLDKRYSTICGYTDHDIDTVFAAELGGLDRQKIRDWYSSYNWLGKNVYNPFDMLLLLERREFKSYWLEIDTPKTPINTLVKQYSSFLHRGHLHSDEELLSSFNVDDMTIEALMFQTGYLTIKKRELLDGNYFYTLGYPSCEVYPNLNRTIS